MTHHTTTPWILTAHGLSACSTFDDKLRIVFAVEPLGDLSLGEARANAEFIVRAVNTHDALIRAANEVLDWWNTTTNRKNGAYVPALYHLEKVIDSMKEI